MSFKLYKKYRNVLSNYPGRTYVSKHDIELISDTPIRLKPYRNPLRQTAIFMPEGKRMLYLGLIEEE